MSKPKILILYAHPCPQQSKVNQVMIERIKGKFENIYVHDLYEIYPDFYINIKHEQELLLKHDVIIFQHPLYWYSCPALLKEWQDVVLEYGFAYGTKSVALHGKELLSVISTGGTESAYQTKGYHQFTIEELLRPFQQTANLCGMIWRTPFLIQGTTNLSTAEVNAHADNYFHFLENYKLLNQNQ